MDNYCAFSKNHKCIKWMDYEITRHELEEADTLCHGNWIEIEQKNQYIQTLQSILDSNHISYPKEIQTYSKGSGIQPDPQNIPSRKTLKPAPQTKPSKTMLFLMLAPHNKPLNRLANPQKLWIPFPSSLLSWNSPRFYGNDTNEKYPKTDCNTTLQKSYCDISP